MRAGMSAGRKKSRADRSWTKRLFRWEEVTTFSPRTASRRTCEAQDNLLFLSGITVQEMELRTDAQKQGDARADESKCESAMDWNGRGKKRKEGKREERRTAS